MEVIAGIASASQIVAYSISCAHYLAQLHSELKDSHSTYSSEETKINLLLDVIRRLPTQNIQGVDPILRILVDISGLACEILYLLQPKGSWTRWTTIPLRNKLALAFEVLDRKEKLLHLYITQASHSALEDMRTSINGHLIASSPAYTMRPRHPAPQVNMTSDIIYGDQMAFTKEPVIHNPLAMTAGIIRGSQMAGNCERNPTANNDRYFEDDDGARRTGSWARADDGTQYSSASSPARADSSQSFSARSSSQAGYAVQPESCYIDSPEAREGHIVPPSHRIEERRPTSNDLDRDFERAVEARLGQGERELAVDRSEGSRVGQRSRTSLEDYHNDTANNNGRKRLKKRTGRPSGS
ncbi:hypothetical protein T440DRAFT_508702 [Plenodomus tracheiphilus IPT5]|uniref:Uncharacterized protein n=1 Tax=Plenodomus tracheiphilus IPT5 TaxID=1408161 RepID=A0A6A7B4D5_9PLEO|nr:hypothetical protein T440DRAFT_508702 [Plenodomus tracheiphilus IPT5]